MRIPRLGSIGRISIATALIGAAMLTAAPAATATESGPPGQLFIPEVDNDTVAVMDTATETINHRFPIKAPIGLSHPAVLAKTPDGAKVYTDNFSLVSPPTIGIIDRRNGTSRTMPIESVALGIFTSADGNEIYIPEMGFVIEVLDVATDTIVRRFRFADIPAGAFPGPDGLIYVGFVSGLIGAYDPQTGAVVKPPIWSGGLAPFWYSFTKDGAKLYTDTVNQIGVIDVKRWALDKVITTSGDGNYSPLNPGAFTSDISPDGRKLYVTRFGGDGVLVFDTADDRLLGTIPTEGDVIGMTFSGDGSRGYIADSGRTSRNLPGPPGESITFMNLITIGALGPGRIITFDPATDKVVSTVPTAAGPGIPVWLPSI
ncbi:YncE family protein [Nocardia altamirensis]|uniref:YncE family protein n=1 Tax=Nocardia altamirensis TaxID=472158 RepID=UPI000AB867CF|nr:YncE family protein [Nocardia altamirensis]